MDEMTMFADLRPNDLSLSPDELADLRADLFATATPAPVPSAAPADRGRLVELDDRRMAAGTRRRRGRVTIAAAAVAAIGLSGVWIIADREASTQRSTPAAQPDTTSPPVTATSPDPFAVPRIALPGDGWTMTYASDTSFAKGRAVVFLSTDDFDGPWVELRVSGAGEMNTGTPITIPTNAVVQAGLGEAQVSEFANGASVYWRDVNGILLEAYLWRTTIADSLDLLNAAAAVDRSVTITALPVGATLADQATTDAVGHYAEYQFTNADGREVQVSLSGGGARAKHRAGGDEGAAVLVGDEDGSLETSDAHYRLHLLRGFWAWRFDGDRFETAQDFIDFTAAIREVDDVTWAESLPDSMVAPAERPTAVAALLDGIPLPNGFDSAALTVGGTDDRYQFIAEVSGAVACGWLDQWFTGEETGDTALQTGAAQALATSKTWPMLLEIADQGGWSDAVWAYADAVNSGEGVMTGDGPVAPTRGEAAGTLGCGN